MTDTDTPAASAPFKLNRVSRARTVKRDERPGWSEWLTQIAFAGVMVLTVSGPWVFGRADPSLSEIRQFGYIAILLATLVAIRPWRYPQHLLAVPWPIMAAVGWCWLSLTWAMFPEAGLKRLILTTIVVWSTFALVREVGSERVIRILRLVLGVLLVVNYAAVFLYPDTGVDPETYEGVSNLWRGVMDQKNFSGFVCAMTVILFGFNAGFPSHDAPNGKAWIGVRAAVVIAAVVFLLASQSKTSIGIGVFALAIGGLVALASKQLGDRQIAAPNLAWIVLGLLAVVALSMATNQDYYLDLVSDESAFTGRTQIWAGLIRAYGEQPLLGVGYGSLWDVGPDGPMKVYAAGSFAADVSQGHNGYLDMLVQIGAPGTLLLLFGVLVWPIQRILRGGANPGRTIGAAMLAFCVGHGFTESGLFDRDTLDQVFWMIAVAILWQTTAARA